MDRCGELKTLLLLYGEYSLEMEMNNYIKKPQTHGTDLYLYAFFFIHGIEKKRHTDRTYPSFGERIYKDGGIDIYLY